MTRSPRPQASSTSWFRQLREGLSQENAKKITKAIRESFPKGVKALIQGDEVRVSSKSRDDLQAVIAMLKELDIDAALQFTNYR